MTNSSSFYAAIDDRNLLVEFRDALTDHAATLEREVATLRRQSDSPDSVTMLFRALHSIKGDSTVCRFDLGVRITHPLETLLSQVREGTLEFIPLLGEAMLLALDRLELAVEALLDTRNLDSLRLETLLDGLNEMAKANADTLEESAIALIEAVTGFRPASAGKASQKSGPKIARVHNETEDLAFFKSLALRLDARSPAFVGRTERLRKLALDTNTRAGSPVAPAQLEAAIYLHDVGMMFLPEEIWLKVGSLSDTDRALLRTHPGYSAGLLSRMEGWEQAATMIAQHHEMADGKGYPLGLKDADMVPGAKIISIVDTFESVTLKHSNRGAGRSLLRAIAEINASDSQFSAEWIGHFNAVVRGMVEG